MRCFRRPCEKKSGAKKKVDAVTKGKKIDPIQSGGKKKICRIQKNSSVIITKKDEKIKTKGGKSASIHFFYFPRNFFIRISLQDCISLRPARTRPVRAIQIIEQEIKSDPIQELRKETRESQNHKKTGATAHIRGKHAAAPRSWRLGERPTVRRKEDVVAEALTEGVASTVPEKTMMSLRRGRRRLGGGRRL